MHETRAGVDVGGTFTDSVVLEPDGTVRRGKVLTVADDQSVGTIAALEKVLDDPAALTSFHHGYTVGINAALTRTGARAALLVTAGHRDTVDIGRIHRPGSALYDPTWRRPHEVAPLVARRYRREIAERMRENGEVLLPLDEEAARRELELLAAEGVEAVGICFLHGHQHPEHERRMRELVEEVLPDAYVQTSAIWPVAGEFERMFVVLVDAYTAPPVVRYLSRLQERLTAAGFTVQPEIMQMNGGLRAASSVSDAPIHTLQSGPVAGLLGAQFYSRRFLDNRSLACIDIGGTSTDFGVIRDGEAEVTNEWELDHAMPLSITTLDVRSIGAGGGSLVTIDEVGSLAVGPESAGSKPGPACYGLGGVQPAMTDAYVAMGLLQPSLFLAGEMELRRDLAVTALESVGKRVGLSATELAQGAWDLMNAAISAAVRGKTINRGLDPRECSIFAYGAAGPMHAVAVARELAIPEVVIPYFPGGFSAFGMIASRKRVEYSSPAVVALAELGADGFNRLLEELAERCRADLRAQGVADDDMTIEANYYGMYGGQSWDNRRPLANLRVDESELEAITEAFHAFYEERFGYRAPEMPLIVTSVAVTGLGPEPELNLPESPPRSAGGLEDAVLLRGDVHLDHRLHHDVPFLDRSRLAEGDEIPGPAVIDDKLGTIVINEGALAVVASHATLRIQSEVR